MFCEMMICTSMLQVLTPMIKGAWTSENLARFSYHSVYIYTVEIRYNGLEGTGELWLLNPIVVKSN